MPRPRNPVPSYLKHRRTGQAYCKVWQGGKLASVDLGPWGSPESKRAYARLCRRAEAESGAAGGFRPGPDPTCQEVAAAFLAHADAYYRRADGTPTGEPKEFGYALARLVDLYGPEPAAEFGPLALKAVRESMVRAGWCRNRVNKQTARVVRAFKWAAAEEMIPADRVAALRAVEGLRKGRSAARETPRVLPVDPAAYEATLPHLTPTLRAMVELQRLTGMRPQQVRQLTAGQVDRSGAVWRYDPDQHKGTHRDKDLRVWIGPRAQAVLAPWLDGAAGPDALLFTPANSRAEWSAVLRARRKSKVPPSQADRRRPRGSLKKRFRGWYSPEVYAQSVARGCRRAGVEPWHPNQLRHLFATEVRARFGLEASQVLLGHARADVTQVYAEKNDKLAAEVAAAVG